MIMKKLLFFAAAALMLSCSDDSSERIEPQGETNPYVGTWDLIAKKSRAGNNLSINPCEEDFVTCKFNSDSTGETNIVGYGENSPCSRINYSGTYTVTDNLLVVKDGNTTVHYTIINRSADQIQLEMSQIRSPQDVYSINENQRVTETFGRVK